MGPAMSGERIVNICYNPMTNELKQTNGNVITDLDIGKEVAFIRLSLNMSQKDFAEAVAASRATINRLERGGDISTDVAFRLFYAMQKIKENIYINRDIKNRCDSLQKYIEKRFILSKDDLSPISYTNMKTEYE